MEMLEKLNIHQMAAVMDESRACLVNAQVGSGKTTVLIAKVCFLHQLKGIPLSDMVVLTFTNKAANEIKDRLTAVDSNVTEDDLAYFGTFHSVALKMLKSLAPLEKIGYTSDFAVMDADERIDLANAIINSNQLTIKYPNKIERRLEEAAKGTFTYGNMKYPDDMNTLWRLYTQEKQMQGKMDFDDLILNITKLLPDISYRPKWIIIDEFQDTDDRQMAFIRALASPETKLFVVGDPNQIIYSWRGSNHRIFERFASEYHATELSLPENYRSCATILEVAKCFLKTGNDLCGIREPGNKIRVIKHYNSFNEAQYIAASIQMNVEAGLKYSDIAVFYRLQRQSQALEDALFKAGIPFEVSLKKKIKDIPVLKWVILLLRASVNPQDIESVIAVLSDNHYGEHLSRNSARKVVCSSRNAADASTISPSVSLFGSSDDSTTDGCESVLLSKIDGFVDWCKGKKSVETVYEYYSFDNYIKPTSSTFRENKSSIETLLKKIDEYITAKQLDLYAGVKDFVNSSALYGIDVLSEDVKTDTDTVKLMTLHSAKGLEFRQVYIIGVNDGLIPLFAKNEDDEQEERRLFFVGITRAKDSLELSYYTSPDESRVCSGPSRYISLIPRRLIDMDGFIQQSVDLQKYRHEIIQNKAMPEASTPETPKEEKEEEESLPAARMVRHPKYGVGTVVSEDDSMITVSFDGYGEKEFIKAFSELENVSMGEDQTLDKAAFVMPSQLTAPLSQPFELMQSNPLSGSNDNYEKNNSFDENTAVLEECVAPDDREKNQLHDHYATTDEMSENMPEMNSSKKRMGLFKRMRLFTKKRT